MKTKLRRRARRRRDAAQIAWATKQMIRLGIPADDDLLAYCQDQEQQSANRASACLVAAYVLRRNALNILIRLATDDASGVVSGAANGLGAIGSRRATRPLMRFIRSSKVQAHRQAAISALNMIKDPRAERLISGILLNQAEPEGIRQSAAEALKGVHHRGRTIEPLVNALRDPSASVRWSVLTTLGCAGDRRATAPIRECLSDQTEIPGLDPNEATVAWAARNALENISGRKWPRGRNR